jgi:predicted O-methyltransferase YrrM
VANKLFQTKAYLNYWLDAVDEHSLHSPFLFDFYTRIVKNKNIFQGIESIEKLRDQLLKDQRQLTINDLGAGSPDVPRKIADIAQASVSPVKLSGLYMRIIEHIKAKTVIELGTSFGINTLYLAHSPSTKVLTFEGSHEIADIAQLTFEFSSSQNIRMILGNIDSTLSESLQSVRKVDFALIDANHRYAPTLRYFNRLVSKVTVTSVVVLDDIHYSPEMERAWTEIKQNKLVYGSIDLFRCGIVFFDPSLNKQHVILQV